MSNLDRQVKTIGKWSQQDLFGFFLTGSTPVKNEKEGKQSLSRTIGIIIAIGHRSAKTKIIKNKYQNCLFLS